MILFKLTEATITAHPQGAKAKLQRSFPCVKKTPLLTFNVALGHVASVFPSIRNRAFQF